MAALSYACPTTSGTVPAQGVASLRQLSESSAASFESRTLLPASRIRTTFRKPFSSKHHHVKTSPKTLRAALSSEESSASQEESGPVEKKRYVRRPKVKQPAEDSNLKAYAVEDENVVVEGVAKIDRGVDTLTVGRLALLVAGDTTALLLFALLGKVSHSGTADFGVVQTAAPFLVGWFTSATLLGAFSADATLAGPLKAATTGGTAWAVGIPLGIVIRGVLKGQIPPTPFMIVTLASTFVLLVGWRAALAATGGSATRADRSGSPFEFMEVSLAEIQALLDSIPLVPVLQ